MAVAQILENRSRQPRLLHISFKHDHRNSTLSELVNTCSINRLEESAVHNSDRKIVDLDLAENPIHIRAICKYRSLVFRSIMEDAPAANPDQFRRRKLTAADLPARIANRKRMRRRKRRLQQRPGFGSVFWLREDQVRNRFQETDIKDSMVGLAIFTDQSGPINADHYRQILPADIMIDLIISALKERTVDCHERMHS